MLYCYIIAMYITENQHNQPQVVDPASGIPMSAWVFSRSLMEEDFSPEEDSAGASVTTLPPISVLAVITVEPVTGRVMGSRWQVAGELENIIKFKA